MISKSRDHSGRRPPRHLPSGDDRALCRYRGSDAVTAIDHGDGPCRRDDPERTGRTALVYVPAAPSRPPAENAATRLPAVHFARRPGSAAASVSCSIRPDSVCRRPWPGSRRRGRILTLPPTRRQRRHRTASPGSRPAGRAPRQNAVGPIPADRGSGEESRDDAGAQPDDRRHRKPAGLMESSSRRSRSRPRNSRRAVSRRRTCFGNCRWMISSGCQPWFDLKSSLSLAACI